MRERQQQLIKNIVGEYIKSAQPLASGFLAAQLPAAVSSATVRNDLVELEQQGYIMQPHTSAGRVPTAKAYQYYVDNFVRVKPLALKIKNQIKSAIHQPSDERQALKNLAKCLVGIIDEAVVVAFARNDVYYTGLSNLLAKPEFNERELVINISQVIDHLDQVIYNSFDRIAKPEIQIGEQCPFGNDCSSIVANYSFQQQRGVIAILGPSRMDYQFNFNIINHIASM